MAWIRVDVTREDGEEAGKSDYVRVGVPEPEPEPVPALPLLRQLLLALGLVGAGARFMHRRRLTNRVTGPAQGAASLRDAAPADGATRWTRTGKGAWGASRTPAGTTGSRGAGGSKGGAASPSPEPPCTHKG